MQEKSAQTTGGQFLIAVDSYLVWLFAKVPLAASADGSAASCYGHCQRLITSGGRSQKTAYRVCLRRARWSSGTYCALWRGPSRRLTCCRRREQTWSHCRPRKPQACRAMHTVSPTQLHLTRQCPGVSRPSLKNKKPTLERRGVGRQSRQNTLPFALKRRYSPSCGVLDLYFAPKRFTHVGCSHCAAFDGAVNESTPAISPVRPGKEHTVIG